MTIVISLSAYISNEESFLKLDVYTCRREFPFVLVLYQDIIVSLHGVSVLIGFADRSLFCTTEDLIENFNSPPSPYCTFSGRCIL